jgi:hypothetical protein
MCTARLKILLHCNFFRRHFNTDVELNASSGVNKSRMYNQLFSKCWRVKNRC